MVELGTTREPLGLDRMAIGCIGRVETANRERCVTTRYCVTRRTVVIYYIGKGQVSYEGSHWGASEEWGWFYWSVLSQDQVPLFGTGVFSYGGNAMRFTGDQGVIVNFNICLI
jgi:hypothetical protein